MKAPYERQDGVRVRQWAVTLPVDIVRRMNHRAVDLGLKPAELVLQVLEQYLDETRSLRKQ
jgi:hypothetical protein